MAARDFLDDDRARRPAILAVVIGAHLAAFLIELPDKRVTDSGYSYTPTSIVPPPPDLSERRPLPPLTVGPITNDITSLPPPALPLVDLSSETPAPGGAAMAPPDWKQSGADAAADAARKEYRALGPRAEEPKIKMPRSPFKQQPPEHKYGDVGEDVQENPVAWLSDKCYVLLENRKARPDDPIATIPMTLCNFRGSKARGDLFEHLRKPQPLP